MDSLILLIFLRNLVNFDYQNLNFLEKNIISFLLKILKNYMLAIFETPKIYQITQFGKIYNFSLDFLADCVNDEFFIEKKLSIEDEKKERKLSNNLNVDRKKSEIVDPDEQISLQMKKKNLEKKINKNEEKRNNFEVKIRRTCKI